MGFFDAAGGGLLGGFIGAIGNIFTNSQQRKENERQRTFEHNEAILAHNRQMNATRELNQYNSPENQANLLKQAGFNPASLLGESGATVGRSTAPAPSAQAHAPSVGGIRPIIDPQMIVALSQAGLNKAQADKTESEKNFIDLQSTQQDIQNQIGEIKLGLEKKFAEVEKQLHLQKLDWDIAVASATESSLKIDKQLKFNELTSLRPLQAMKLVADTIETNTTSTLNQCLAAKTDQERRHAVGMHFATLGLVAANTAKSYADANKANTDANNWAPGSGILWQNANNDYWLGHHDVNTSTLENGIYQQILRIYQQDIQKTYGAQLKDTLFKSRYGAKYWSCLKDDTFWTRLFMPSPSPTGQSGIMTFGQKAGDAAVAAALRKALLKF